MSLSGIRDFFFAISTMLSFEGLKPNMSISSPDAVAQKQSRIPVNALVSLLVPVARSQNTIMLAW
jgi:hypothetical protein